MTTGYSREDCERDWRVRAAVSELQKSSQWRHKSALLRALPYRTSVVMDPGRLSARVRAVDFGNRSTSNVVVKIIVRGFQLHSLIGSDIVVASM